MSTHQTFNPTSIEIEINANCNMSCSYCPNSIENRNSLGDMKPELFDKLVSQLREVDYKGKIAFDFYNEPLLSKNFDNYVKKIKKDLPLCQVELFSNGTKINSKERLEELLDIGIDHFCITKHEGLKKLKVEDYIQDLPDHHRRKIQYRNYDNMYLTNRGGVLKDVGEKINNTTPCYVPSVMMTVTVEGNVLPCFEDFNETLVMGNIEETHIKDIWHSPKFSGFRQDLKDGRRDKYEVCKDCNRVSHNMRNNDESMYKVGEEELEAVKRVIESRQLFRYRPTKGECDLFEDEMCNKFNVEYAHMVTSGTNALIAALKASGIGPGDEVIIPSYTFVATASAVVNVGAIPVVVNIDDQLGICLDDIERNISDRTKAIIPVHMDGLCCDMEKICTLATEKKLIVIEDACQAFGAKFKGRHLGTWGDFGCFSFNQDKVVTCGEGGVVITKTRENYEKLLLSSDSGYSFSPMHQDKFKEVSPFMGSSMRVSEISGAIMRVQMSRLDSMLDAYKKRKDIFLSKLENVKNIEVINGRDASGECSVSLHLKFSDPITAQLMGKKIRNNRILAAPPSTRPAHCVWKWSSILGKNASNNDKLNPYLNTDREYDYSKKKFLSSIDILFCVLKINIEMSMSIGEVQAQAETLRQLLTGEKDA